MRPEPMHWTLCAPRQPTLCILLLLPRFQAQQYGGRHGSHWVVLKSYQLEGWPCWEWEPWVRPVYWVAQSNGPKICQSWAGAMRIVTGRKRVKTLQHWGKHGKMVAMHLAWRCVVYLKFVSCSWTVEMSTPSSWTQHNVGFFGSLFSNSCI